VDKLQERIANYACNLDYKDLPPEIIHAAKVRVIDTLGCLIGGFFAEPSQLARAVAAQVSSPMAATILGTREKSSPEMAAFANATAVRYAEYNDVYQSPGGGGGHPSDVITPILAVAEPTHASGKDFLTAIVLAYEVLLRLADPARLDTRGFDYTNFICLTTAIGAGKVLRLSTEQMSQCISLAIVPNNSLAQARNDNLTMWKAMASGQAGKAGVFAALLARQGVEGPNLPFEGAAGWFTVVTGKPISLETIGGNGVPFRTLEARIKPRACCANTISSALATEKARATIKSPAEVERIVVETYAWAKDRSGTKEHHWHPQTRETADHSIPYVVAATLIDGSVGPRQFADERLFDPNMVALMQKIEVVCNPEFTKSYNRLPQAYCTRVEVVTKDGSKHVGEVSSIKGDISDPLTDAEIEEKFRCQCQEFLGKKRVRAILDSLWQIEKMDVLTEIPPAFVL